MAFSQYTIQYTMLCNLNVTIKLHIMQYVWNYPFITQFI